MGEARTFASLSSGLLARKGAAKPAMRPQGYNHFGGHLEDLGWNDMGAADPVAEHMPSPVTALSPAPRQREEELAPPPVVEQQRAIAESFAEDVEPAPERAPAPTARARQPKRPPAPAKPQGRKAAFTLRLDAERHYKLRLASAVSGRSAQNIVTAAFDQWLKNLPEIEGLASQLPPKAAS